MLSLVRAVVKFCSTNRLLTFDKCQTNSVCLVNNLLLLFLVKVLEKRHIIKEKKVAYVSREKEALAMTNHPFIVRLYFTFQDKENLCIFLLLNSMFLFSCMVVDFAGPNLLDLSCKILQSARHDTF